MEPHLIGIWLFLQVIFSFFSFIIYDYPEDTYLFSDSSPRELKDYLGPNGIYLVGAVQAIDKNLNKIDYARCTNLGAIVHVVLVALKFLLLLTIYTFLSLLVTLVVNAVVRFKAMNYNLPLK